MVETDKPIITHNAVHDPRCNRLELISRTITKKKTWSRPRFLFVFEHGDLNTAAHYLAEQMHDPFKPFPIPCVAVHESVHDEFVERLRSRFRQLPPHVATNEFFEQTRRELAMGKIKHVIASEENAPSYASPILVTDKISHLFFSSTPSGVVTLKRFGTIKEASDIFASETPQFDSVHLFDECITSVYALAARISCIHFYVNCFDVCTMPILPFYGMRQVRALMTNGFHFETVELAGLMRIIVFPISSTFVRRCCCPLGQCTCHRHANVCCDNKLYQYA